MGLQRYALSAHEDFTRGELYVAREADPGGRYMDATDVDALLARIRAAVEAMHDAENVVLEVGELEYYAERENPYACARDALDALLGVGDV